MMGKYRRKGAKKRLTPVCRHCGKALVMDRESGLQACPEHGVQRRYSWAAGGKVKENKHG